MYDDAIFKDVVMGTALYKGWGCIYAGLGRVVLVKDGREVVVEKDGEGWLYAAWGEARQRVDEIEGAATLA